MREFMMNVSDVLFSLRKIKEGSDVSSAKHTAEININGKSFPCILRSKNYGSFKKMEEGIEGNLVIGCYKQTKTKYTENGYVVLCITATSTQIWIYIKKDILLRFYEALLG
jgi:hypothetical protein